jgi:hypothetical protein
MYVWGDNMLTSKSVNCTLIAIMPDISRKGARYIGSSWADRRIWESGGRVVKFRICVKKGEGKV